MFEEFAKEFYNILGLTYSYNEALLENYSTFDELNLDTKGKAKVWQQKLIFNEKFEYINSYSPYAAFDPNLKNNEVHFSYTEYNEIFGTSYTENTIDTFVPHSLTVTHYNFSDANCKNPLFTTEFVVVALTTVTWRAMGVSEEIYNLFWKDHTYANALYFDGVDGIGAVLDMAEILNYEPQNHIIEGVHTMTKAVDVFVPIFELIGIFLCVGVVFILMNFSSKMIKDKMHEIGILKALGTKNTSIGVVFGLQVGLIAILTSVLSTVGYYFFIDMANDILIESLLRLAPSHIVLDLDFLTFRPEIAAMNCLLIFALALISLIFPLIKIKAIKPVKIIKAKD
jgi:ABC-type antimicrobial peptide transport system permease subunit